MLLQFTVENYRSIREAVSLSCVAAPGVEHVEGQVHLESGHEVLRVVALYGANGSGKSNIVRALENFITLATQGVAVGAQAEVDRFAFDPSSEAKATRFAVIVAVSEKTYAYTLSILAGRVVEESLRLLGDDSAEEEDLFVRIEDDAHSGGLVISPKLATGERKTIINFVYQGTRPEQPLLAEARARNVKELDEIVQALLAITVVTPQRHYRNLALRVEENRDVRDFLGAILRDADTGIAAVTTRKTDVSTLPLEQRALFEALASLGHGSAEERSIVKHAQTFMQVELFAEHHSPSGRSATLAMREESDGTRRFLHLAPILFNAEKAPERQNISVIDELERSLHPLLTRTFIKRFLAAGSSALPQLIFTTHDVNLLDLELLPIDSFWFVEKDDTEATNLYSLAEYKPEQIQSFKNSGELERGYLQGRFGGIPKLRDRSLSTTRSTPSRSGNGIAAEGTRGNDAS